MIHTRERLFHLVVTAGLVQAPVCQQVLPALLYPLIAMNILSSVELVTDH